MCDFLAGSDVVGADEGAPVEDLGGCGCEGSVRVKVRGKRKRKGWHGRRLWGFGIALRVCGMGVGWMSEGYRLDAESRG